MRASSRCVVVFAALALAPALTEAQAGVLTHGFDSSEPHCQLGTDGYAFPGTGCERDLCDGGRVCVDLAGMGARCLDRDDEIVCVLGSCEACPLAGGAAAVACREDVRIDGAAHALCIYAEPLACLADLGFALDLAACVPLGGTPDLSGGDCDGDDIPNGEDDCPCLPSGPTDPSVCVPVVVPVDAGTIDGGALDAGTSTLPDASVTGDAGAAPSDAGTRFDAGPGFDAGPRPSNVAPSFLGGGGLTCRAAPSPSPPVGLAVFALALAVRVARSVRRRRVNEPPPTRPRT